MVRRAASIFLPMWPIDLIRRRQRECCQPILIITLERGVQIVQHRCERAAHAGVVPGMTLAHARALLNDSECQVVEHDPLRDAQSLHKLAMWAQRFSPLVAVDPPEGLLLDITGCEQVFGGEERLAQRMFHDLNRLGFHARVAIASTFACAAAVARVEPRMNTDEHGFDKEKNTNQRRSERHSHDRSASSVSIRVHPWFYAVVPPGDERAALAALPLRALRIDQSIIDALHEIEIIRIGQLFDLPRSQLADRYGDELLLRLDQALGEALEVIDPVRLKDPPRVEHVFDGPVLQIEGIELMTRSLLEKLIEQLLKLERGICRLDVAFTRIDAPPMRFTVRLSHPSRNVKHIWSLLKPKIENINLGFGVEEIALVASRSRMLAHEQNQFTAEHAESAERNRNGNASFSAFSAISAVKYLDAQAGELIDTLCNRLGADRVLQVQLRESHVPERSFRLCSALDAEPLVPGSAGMTAGRTAVSAAMDRPTLLLPRPERIAVHCDQHVPSRLTWGGIDSAIISCIGPEAIASEWWKESPSGLREYYKVQDERGMWLWIYYAHGSVGEWWIHGVWA